MCQFQVVLSPLTTVDASSPLPIASYPLGAVRWKSNRALSRGWLLFGNQPIAPFGSFMLKEPKDAFEAMDGVVRMKPSSEPSESTKFCGVPL